MTHQTNTVASTADMLADLETFCATYAGYTGTSGNIGSGATLTGATVRKFEKDGQADIHISYHSTYDELRLLMDLTGVLSAWPGTDYIVASAQNDKISAELKTINDVTKYHFFTNGDEVFVACKLARGIWVHFAFGFMAGKRGTWTGGTFVTVSRGNTYSATQANDPTNDLHGWMWGSPKAVANIYDLTKGEKRSSFVLHFEQSANRKLGIVNRYDLIDVSIGTYYSKLYPATFGGMKDENILQTSNYSGSMAKPNDYNGRSIGHPWDIYTYNVSTSDASNPRYTPLGSILGARFVNIQNLDEEDIINTDWMVFPLCTKGVSNYSVQGKGWATSGNFGIAYKIGGV